MNNQSFAKEEEIGSAGDSKYIFEENTHQEKIT